MQFTKVSYGKTFNLGQYQSERIDTEATIADGEDPQTAVLLLKVAVLKAGGDRYGADDAAAEAAERALGDRRG